MRHLFPLIIGVVFFAAPAGARPVGSVSVTLQLPKSSDLAATDPLKLLDDLKTADALIFELLGTDKKPVSAKSEKGPLLIYDAAYSAESLPSAVLLTERGKTIMRRLQDIWGSNVLIEIRMPKQTRNFGPDGDLQHQSAPIDFAALRGELDNGHARYYDRARESNEGAVPVPAAAQPAAVAVREQSGLTVPKTLPQSHVVPPLESERTTPYSDIIKRAALNSGVSLELLHAVVAAKSKYNAGRVSGGGYGLMAISAGNAKAYGLTARDMLDDPEKNLMVGSKLLAALLKQFGGNEHRALAAYQVGPHAVLRSGGIPQDKDVRDFLNAVELARDPDSRVARLPVKPAPSPLRDVVQLSIMKRVQASGVGAEFFKKVGKVVHIDEHTYRSGDGVAAWRDDIEMAAENNGVDPLLMEAMIMQENAPGDPKALSGKGARGFCQFMPRTALGLSAMRQRLRDLGMDPKDFKPEDPDDHPILVAVKDLLFDPVLSINCMAEHMRHLSDVFQDNPVLISAAYNGGEGRVKACRPGDKVTYDRKGTPLGCVPSNRETSHYVDRVSDNMYVLAQEKAQAQTAKPLVMAKAGL